MNWTKKQIPDNVSCPWLYPKTQNSQSKTESSPRPLLPPEGHTFELHDALDTTKFNTMNIFINKYINKHEYTTFIFAICEVDPQSSGREEQRDRLVLWCKPTQETGLLFLKPLTFSLYCRSNIQINKERGKDEGGSTSSCSSSSS